MIKREIINTELLRKKNVVKIKCRSRGDVKTVNRDYADFAASKIVAALIVKK